MELPHFHLPRFSMSVSGSNGTPGSDIILTKKSGKDNKPALSELSPHDKPWDKHKAESDQIQKNYENTEFSRYAERISFCSQLLDFRLVPNNKESGYRFKLAGIRLCHTRTCQICSWRRSLMYKARAYKALPAFINDYPNTRYLFMTLTIKNCHITMLRQTIMHLNESFARLTKLKLWPGIAYLKSVEVTRSDRFIDGMAGAHPHLHILMALKPSYYARHYIKKSKWISLWANCLRVEYSPILHMTAIKADESPLGLLAEIVKYQTKPNDLIFADKDWFLEYTRQIYGTKAFSLGGEFRKYFRELEKPETDEEMIGSDDKDEIDEGHLLFGWKKWEKKYRLVGDNT